MNRHPFIRDGKDGQPELYIPREGEADLVAPLSELALVGLMAGLAHALQRRLREQLRNFPPPPG